MPASAYGTIPDNACGISGMTPMRGRTSCDRFAAGADTAEPGSNHLYGRNCYDHQPSNTSQSCMARAPPSDFGAKMALLALKIARAETGYKFRLEFAA